MSELITNDCRRWVVLILTVIGIRPNLKASSPMQFLIRTDGTSAACNSKHFGTASIVLVPHCMQIAYLRRPDVVRAAADL